MPEDVKRSGPRTYVSPLRARQAEETRHRVLAAATELFVSRGYAATTIAAVARAAGVSADTVFHLFTNKRGLLKAAADVTVAGDDADLPLLERAGPQAVRRETDQRRQLAVLAVGIAEQLDRIRPVEDMLVSAAAVDEEVRALHEDMHLRQRRSAMRTIAGWIAARGPMQVPVAEAGDVLWTLTSPSVHRMLRVHCGWSREAYAEWLRSTLSSTLLGPEG